MAQQLDPGRVISSQENPELANAMARQLLTDSPAGDDEKIPTLQRPPMGAVELPGGLLEGETVITDAEVRELTGADEEALAKTDAAVNIGRFVQVVLQRAVTRIGPHEPPDKDVLAQLLLGDRDALVLAIRKVTYGNEMEQRVQCGFCEEVLDITLDLDSDIPVTTMDDRAQRRFDVELRNGTASVRLPIGEDQDLLYARPTISIPEANTLLLSRCITMFNGQPNFGDQGLARSLGLRDRKTILDFLADNQPGPKYEGVKVNCASCEREIPIAVRLADLFRG